jgi:nitrile hydratase
VVSQKEITTRALAIGARKSDLIAAQPNKQLATPIKQPTAQGAQRSLNHAPKFEIHTQIRTTNQSVPGHTRLPAYARGKTGTVIKHHGVWVFPDSNAHGEGEQPQHLYTIAFRATDLWDDGEHGVQVSLDLFESYLHAGDYSNDMYQQ